MESVKWAIVGGALVAIGFLLGTSRADVDASGAAIKESAGAGSKAIVTSSSDGKQIYVWGQGAWTKSASDRVRCFDIENGKVWERELPTLPSSDDTDEDRKD